MKGCAGFYNGMERDLANHNQGLGQSVLESEIKHGHNTDLTVMTVGGVTPRTADYIRTLTP